MALLGVMTLASCDDGDEDYTPGEQDSGYYLYSTSSSYTVNADEQEVISIYVARTDSSEAGSVDLTCDNSIFNCPSSVSFSAGEKTKAVLIPFDMEIGETETVTISVPSAEATVYGTDSLTLTVTRDYNWVSAGTATFYDDFLYGLTASVDVQHASGTNIYRLLQPYTVAFQAAGETTLPVSDNLQFTADSEGNVTVSDGFFYPDQTKSVIPYFLYYDAVNYPSYCNVVVEGTKVTINCLGGSTDDMAVAYVGDIAFDWVDGCPWSE